MKTGLARLFAIRNLAISLMFLMLAPCPALAQEKSIYDQVVEIVASDRGTVRKWAYAPKVTVIHEGEPHQDAIQGLVELVNGSIPNFPGVGAVEFFDLGQFDRQLAGNTHFRMRTTDFNGVEGSIVGARFRGETEEQDILLTGNIFIFLTGLENGILFGALTQSEQRLGRQFAEGTATPCYFNLMSLNDELRAGFIFINTDYESLPIAECLYEEFLQTLGLLNDSEGSSVFTFDNTAALRDSNDADFRLLQALYSQQVAAGDPAERVAEMYLSLQ